MLRNLRHSLLEAVKILNKIVLTPKINQPADSCGGNLSLFGPVTQLKENILHHLKKKKDARVHFE